LEPAAFVAERAEAISSD
jgi:hypothetical protein